jgi:hypothetical protein
VETLDSVAAHEPLSGPDAASDPATVLLRWRTPARRRWSCIAWSLFALAAAIAVEVTGPQRPVTFSMRLPLIVAACGALWCAARWRRQVVVITAEVAVRTLVRTRRLTHGAAAAEAIARADHGRLLPGRLRIPVPSAVPMMTPCLVMSSALVVTLGTAKVLSAAPRMSGVLVALSAAACIAALAACFRFDRGDRPPKAVSPIAASPIAASPTAVSATAVSAKVVPAKAVPARALRDRRGLGMSGNR